MLRLLLSAFFILAGIMHFEKTPAYLSVMPPYIPHPFAAVYVSGLFEVLLGLLVIPVKTRRLAGWGLIVLLLAVFPANIHMALHPELFPRIPVWMLYLRLPVQFMLMIWVKNVLLDPPQTAS